MIDLNVLSSRGVDTDKLKSVFDGDDVSIPDKAKPLLFRIRDRIADGLQW